MTAVAPDRWLPAASVFGKAATSTASLSASSGRPRQDFRQKRLLDPPTIDRCWFAESTRLHQPVRIVFSSHLRSCRERSNHKHHKQKSSCHPCFIAADRRVEAPVRAFVHPLFIKQTFQSNSFTTGILSPVMQRELTNRHTGIPQRQPVTAGPVGCESQQPPVKCPVVDHIQIGSIDRRRIIDQAVKI